MRKQRPQQHMPQPPPGRSGTGVPLPVAPPPGPSRYAVATDLADVISPFLASGGYTFWPSITESRLLRAGVEVDYQRYTAADGAQLVTSAFIPWGKVGFLKEVRIAPMKPSILADVWNTTGVTTMSHPNDTPNPVDFGLFGSYQAHRSHMNTYTGIWDVPMGWESYDTLSEGALEGGFVPDPWQEQLAWQWQLTVLDGAIPNYKTSSNIPRFDPLNPVSWYLTESIPVPALTYANGFPGRPIGVPQRMQVMPGDAIHTHAVIPSNSTICLWARWFNTFEINEGSQLVPGVPIWMGRTDEPFAREFYNGLERVPVIGPSVGSLHGYTQPEVSGGSNANATQGWGG